MDHETRIKQRLMDDMPKLDWDWLKVHNHGYAVWRKATEARQESERLYQEFKESLK